MHSQGIIFIINTLLGLWWEKRRGGNVQQRNSEPSVGKHLLKVDPIENQRRKEETKSR